MSTADLNREQKRALKRMGTLDDKGNPVRTQPQPRGKAAGEGRTGPITYLSEVRDEMRKVAWPRWPEVRRYATVVLVTVVLLTAYVGALDALFGVFSGWLYKE
jgi:preprotein translocase subunit SecE